MRQSCQQSNRSSRPLSSWDIAEEPDLFGQGNRSIFICLLCQLRFVFPKTYSSPSLSFVPKVVISSLMLVMAIDRVELPFQV